MPKNVSSHQFGSVTLFGAQFNDCHWSKTFLFNHLEISINDGFSYLINLVRQPQAAIRSTASSIHAANPQNNHTTNEFLFQSPLSAVFIWLSNTTFGKLPSTILEQNIHVLLQGYTQCYKPRAFVGNSPCVVLKHKPCPTVRTFLYLAITMVII